MEKREALSDGPFVHVSVNADLTRVVDCVAMAKDILVSLRLKDDLLVALARAARADSCSPAEFMRRALNQVLVGRVPPRKPRDIGVRDAARDATGWTDLQSRLRALGFMLRAQHGAVVLHGWPRDRPLIRAEAAGIDCAALTLRFGAPFPGFAGSAPDDAVRPRAARPEGPGGAIKRVA